MGLSGESIRVCSNEKQESVRKFNYLPLKKEEVFPIEFDSIIEFVAMQYKGL